MNRKASLVLVAMLVSAIGVVGCNRVIPEDASDDGSTAAAAPESPAAEPATASPAPASPAPASQAPVAASRGPVGAPVINHGDVGPLLGKAASIVGRTAARARAAYERMERRQERMRERREHRRFDRPGRG